MNQSQTSLVNPSNPLKVKCREWGWKDSLVISGFGSYYLNLVSTTFRDAKNLKWRPIQKYPNASEPDLSELITEISDPRSAQLQTFLMVARLSSLTLSASEVSYRQVKNPIYSFTFHNFTFVSQASASLEAATTTRVTPNDSLLSEELH